MLLGARETVVRSAYAVLDRGSHDADRRRPGVLYLTTERLVFEAPGSRGAMLDLLGGRDPDLLVDVALAAVRNVSVRSGRLVKARLVVEAEGRRAAFDVLEPHVWTNEIAEVRRASELGRESRHAARDAAVPPPVVKVRCRYCGSLGDERHHRCPACGAPL
ncbi:MAG TPA: hypothetical protein VMH49_02795 [Thermoplasmata archaeon]|nr:hypothetical protein [Thermoplasmata archaeon]